MAGTKIQELVVASPIGQLVVPIGTRDTVGQALQVEWVVLAVTTFTDSSEFKHYRHSCVGAIFSNTILPKRFVVWYSQVP